MAMKDEETIRAAVRERYAEIARSAEGSPESCCSGSCGCAGGEAAVSSRLGYSPAEMTEVPEGANLGLGCGNPQAIAGLKAGEVVVDLGSGGGFDCFLAAKAVGETGKVIGVDMTPEMIARSRANAAKGATRNVDFRLGEIEHLPIADSSADVVMSNCVINLSPDKKAVFSETFRVLRAGGRLAIADVVAVRPIPAALKADLNAYAACVSGAASVEEVRAMLAEAGFAEIEITVKEESRDFIKDWSPGDAVDDFARSAYIQARKPAAHHKNGR